MQDRPKSKAWQIRLSTILIFTFGVAAFLAGLVTKDVYMQLRVSRAGKQIPNADIVWVKYRSSDSIRDRLESLLIGRPGTAGDMPVDPSEFIAALQQVDALGDDRSPSPRVRRIGTTQTQLSIQPQEQAARIPLTHSMMISTDSRLNSLMITSTSPEEIRLVRRLIVAMDEQSGPR